MDDDDFVEDLSQNSTSKSKSVSRSDAKFAPPRPVTPKKDRVVVRERVSESENSTAVAGNVTETDESTLTSGDITSAEDVLGSQSECATEEDSLLSSPSPGKPKQWELVKTWIRSGYSMDTIFGEIVTICKAEQAAAGCVKSKNLFTPEEGHILFRARNIAGFSRSHVRLFSCFFACLFFSIVTLFFIASSTKK